MRNISSENKEQQNLIAAIQEKQHRSRRNCEN